MSKVIILGAKGRFGRAATHAFVAAGWEVTTFGRNWTGPTPNGTTRVTGDASDTEALTRACMGQDVIVNAINPPYEDWVATLPKLTKAVIAATRAAGATLMLPGNVYNYGANGPERWVENTPWHPTSRKGELRVTLENAYRDAGVRTIVLRAGDYLEQGKSNNWFDRVIAPKARQGKLIYPGPLDRVHAWGYLPDVGRAAVMLAEKRDEFSSFEQFGIEGFSLTGAELADGIAAATGKAQKVSGFPWFALRIMGLFNPAMRELLEMRYLWNVRHRIDDSKLMQVLPDFKPTPLAEALSDVMAA